RREAEGERQLPREALTGCVLRGLGLVATAIISTSYSQTNSSSEVRATNRKFDFDTSAVETLTREAKEAPLRQIEDEQAEAPKSKLPDFWLPSLTPTYSSTGLLTSLSDVKLQTKCHGANPALRPLAYGFPARIPIKWSLDKMSSSIPLRFVESTPAMANFGETPEPKSKAVPREDEQPQYAQPTTKQLSNGTLMHRTSPVYPAPGLMCTDMFVASVKQSIVCDLTLDYRAQAGRCRLLRLSRRGSGP
ncbi:hypothetical protein LXA43DRAFT_887182, partial [Ganoderma leucocontextum]